VAIGRSITVDRAAMAALVVVAADQLSKRWAFAATTAGDKIDVFPGLTIGQTRNDGIAFGFFSGRPWIVFGLMLVALVVLVWFYVRHRGRPVLWLATGLLLGGAIGNALDRIALGYVRDFIDFSSFPSFNLADVSITVGVVVLVLTAEQHPPGEQPETATETAQRSGNAPQEPSSTGEQADASQAD
jgi:signal peptidase II